MNTLEEIPIDQPLPTGTVSFLFTDIEGSTKLAQEYPGELPSLLAKHHAILHAAIQKHQGRVFQIVGDAFCAAFPTAAAALDAALEAQRALVGAAWDPAPVRVRMGIHSGAVTVQANESVGGGYRGYLTLARAQRIMSAAHGGQLLLSGPAAELLGGFLPDQVTLRDLGEHKLKSLENPERLWQAVAPGLPQEFPPIRSLNPSPGNLPVQLTSFIGRARELDQVQTMLSAARLLTLTGVGGTGKTRLALQAAAEIQDGYPGGAWLVELAPLSDPGLIHSAVKTALRVREQPGRPVMEALLDFLRPKRLLLILDNCEHLIEACARFADEALRACPGLAILATSREALGIAGEHIYPVPSLELPRSPEGASLAGTAASESVQLFSERAAAVQPRFSLTEENAGRVAQICRRLDGIPLAIELAAARVRSMPVEQLADRLDDRFRLLTGGSRTALPRQQTLRATVDWSYNLLGEPERLLLHRISLFAGGFTLEAAAAVSGGDRDSLEVLDGLASLVDKSLLRLDEHLAGPRYTLLETTRQYAREKLLDSGEMAVIRRRHLSYYLDFAEAGEPEVRGPRQADWLRRLEADLDNIRLALEFGSADDPPRGLRLASALWWFWNAKNHIVEGERWLRDILQKPENGARSIHRGRALGRLGFLGSVSFRNNSAQADLKWASEGLEICRETNDRAGQGYALFFLGYIVCNSLRDYPAAWSHFETAAEIFEETQDLWGLARVQFNIGNLITYQGGKVSDRILYCEKSLALCRAIGDLRGIAAALDNLGNYIVYHDGDLWRALALVEEALDIYQQNELYPRDNALRVLTEILCWQGEFQRLDQVWNERLEMDRQSGNQLIITLDIVEIGAYACTQGRLEEGVRLLEQQLGSLRGETRNPYAVSSHKYALLMIAYSLAHLGEAGQAKNFLDEFRQLQDANKWRTSFYNRTLGLVALLNGEGQQACRCYGESLRYARQAENILAALLAVEGYAWGLALDAQHAGAAQLLAAAAAFRERIGAPVFPMDRPLYDRVIAGLQQDLGVEAFARAWADGRALDLAQAVEFVLREN